mmetsp:Transcript_31702/g.93304  ORF Transcript_31702/g.93304 Transcript_31702/m.93304 type:complete len:355 (+) Transcript_31702:895-1959(+)
MVGMDTWTLCLRGCPPGVSSVLRPLESRVHLRVTHRLCQGCIFEYYTHTWVGTNSTCGRVVSCIDNRLSKQTSSSELTRRHARKARTESGRFRGAGGGGGGEQHCSSPRAHTSHAGGRGAANKLVRCPLHPSRRVLLQDGEAALVEAHDLRPLGRSRPVRQLLEPDEPVDGEGVGAEVAVDDIGEHRALSVLEAPRGVAGRTPVLRVEAVLPDRREGVRDDRLRGGAAGASRAGGPRRVATGRGPRLSSSAISRPHLGCVSAVSRADLPDGGGQPPPAAHALLDLAADDELDVLDAARVELPQRVGGGLVAARHVLEGGVAAREAAAEGVERGSAHQPRRLDGALRDARPLPED